MASPASPTMTSDIHKPLRDDVRLLGELLGETLRQREGEDAVPHRRRRASAGQERARGDRDDFERWPARWRMPIDAALPVARAFAHFLNLANIAEQHHRVAPAARISATRRPPQPGSCEEAFARLIAAGVSRRALRRGGAAIELVLTAHPTEIVAPHAAAEIRPHRARARAAGPPRPDP